MAVGPSAGAEEEGLDAVDASGAVPRLVVLRALGLGDLLTAVPAMRGLARAFPDHRRTLLAPAQLAPLAALTGAVDDTVDVDFRDRVDLACPLPVAAPVDVAVNLHGAGPPSHRWLAGLGARRTIAFGSGAAAWDDDEHEVARWCRLLTAHGIDADPDDLDVEPPPNAGETRSSTGHRRAGVTVVHPGAASAARRWPAERWAAVARAEAEAGSDVVVTGSAAEQPLAVAVAEAAGLPRQVVLAGRTSLLELVTLIGNAARVVCGDTGIAHVATATRTPSVVLFGPTSPTRWGPSVGRSWHRVLWHGSTGDPHANEPDPGLLRIGVAEVLLALATLPDARQAVSRS